VTASRRISPATDGAPNAQDGTRSPNPVNCRSKSAPEKIIVRIPESARVGIDAAATARTITVDAAATAGTITVDGAQTGNGIDLQWSQPAPTTAHVTLTLGIGQASASATSR
jgi:hypothetical protein